MKTTKIFALFLGAALLITSCKDDDKGTPKQTTKTFEYSGILRGSKDILGTATKLPVIHLSEIIGADQAGNLTSAAMQNGDCYIAINGLTDLEQARGETVVLKNFTISIGKGASIVLGDCKVNPAAATEFASDTEQSTQKYLNIVSQVFNALTTGNKTAQLTVSFTPSVDITEDDNIRLKIGIGGTYYYVEYE